MRRKAKIDGNQNRIVDKLRRLGISVAVTSALGKGFPDLVIGYRGKNYLLELKDPAQPPSKRVLTPDEKDFHEAWRGQIWVVTDWEEIYNLINN